MVERVHRVPRPTGIVPTDGPPPRKTVEYSTGRRRSAPMGAIGRRPACRRPAACRSSCRRSATPDRIAQDKDPTIFRAVARLWAQSGLKALANSAKRRPKPAVTIHRHCRSAESEGGAAAVFPSGSTRRSRRRPMATADPAAGRPAPGIGLSGGRRNSTADRNFCRHFCATEGRPFIQRAAQGSTPAASPRLLLVGPA